MSKAKEIQIIIRRKYNKPFIRKKMTIGCSQVAFCMEKILLQERLGIPSVKNGKMFLGQFLHSTFFREVVEEHPYGSAHGKKFWLKPRFEENAYYTDSRGFQVAGHCDCDIPSMDLILEAKFTFSKREYTPNDLVTQAYMQQANAYACILGRKTWEIWIFFIDFEDINDPFVSVIEGKSDKHIFDVFLERCYFISQALKSNDIDLIAPEEDWECRYCSYLFECPYFKTRIPPFEQLIPNSKQILTAQDEKLFNMYVKKKWIHYDRSEKKYILDR